jgi:autotransporter-associated beta strand protein
VTASGGAGRKLALRGAAAGEIQGSLDRTGSFSLNIYKLDSGTWTLSGANTPAGPTTVSNGVLVVSGSLDSTLVTVAGGTLALSGAGALINSTPMTVLAGATLDASGRTDGTLTVGASQSLSGNGTVVGNLLVQGTLTPGASVGRLSASANVSFDGTAQTVMEVNNAAATNDLLTAAGTVTYGGTLTITNISATPYTNNQVLKLFNAAGGFAGSFANIVFPGVAVYDASRLAVDGTIKVAAPLSTARTNLTTTVTGGNVLNVSWPLDHTTWRLLAQTNAPGVGLTPSWFEVPGSASTNRLVLPIDPTVGSVFYRLVYP